MNKSISYNKTVIFLVVRYIKDQQFQLILLREYDICSSIMSLEIYDYEQLDIMAHGAHRNITETKNPNRLYLNWKNSSGTQCKMIGPETKCFCNHRFKQHEYINPVNGKTHCSSTGCKCKTFEYIPTHGSYDFKCLCKHSFKEHDRNSKTCQRQKCQCNVFSSAWTCSCGQKYDQHQTVSQTFEQRQKQGKQMNDMNRMASQLEANIKQGSLYKPIKQDRQSKMRRHSQILGHRESVNVTSITSKHIADDDENQIEEIDLKRVPK